MNKSSLRPDGLMEAAKRTAAAQPGQLVKVDLSEHEEFAVTYDRSRNTYDCTRSVVTKKMKIESKPAQ